MFEIIEPKTGGVRHAILTDVDARIRASRPIHGFVVDSLMRMHPADIADDLGANPLVREDVTEEMIRAASPLDARDDIGYNVGPTIVPFAPPLNLLRTIKVYPPVYKETGVFDAFISLAEQRYWLREGGDPNARVVSEELVQGLSANKLQVADAIKSWLYYQDQVVLDQAIDKAPLLDTTESTSTDPFEPEVIIGIPVANGQEHETLARTLILLAEQSLDFDRYEIVLLHNTRLSDNEFDHLDSNPSDVPEEISCAQVKETAWLLQFYSGLRERYPALRLRANFAIHGPDASIGYCRVAIAQDVGRKYLERGSQNNPLFLSMDADVNTLNKDYLNNLIQTANATDAPAICSRVSIKEADELDRNSNSSKLLRFGQFVYEVAMRAAGEPPLMDSGTAIRLREYCLAGGHHWGDRFSENINIVKILRATWSIQGLGPGLVISRNSRLGTNSRRQIDTMAKGYHPLKAWEPEVTTFANQDDMVRIQAPPYKRAEQNATEHLDEWIEGLVIRNFGNLDGYKFLQRRDVIIKGLHIIGLPNIFGDITSNIVN